MNRVLVTGASGFIGRFAVPILSGGGYEVHALYYPEPIELEENPTVSWHHCDLMDEKAVQGLMRDVKPTHLLHFAWYTEHGEYWNSVENLRWVKASVDLVKKFADEGGRRVVTAGTCAEYDWDYGYLSERVTPLRPETLYGRCKDALNRIIAGFADVTGTSAAWGRIFFPYGPHEGRKRLVPDVIISLLEDRRARSTHGNQVRDYIYIEDAAAAFVDLLSSDVEGPVNIATGEPVSLKTIIFTIADLLGKRELVDLGALPEREGEAPFVVADTRRLRDEVGWKPRFTLESGLNNAVEWWRKNP